jgi:hypothetical protein
MTGLLIKGKNVAISLKCPLRGGMILIKILFAFEKNVRIV